MTLTTTQKALLATFTITLIVFLVVFNIVVVIALGKQPETTVTHHPCTCDYCVDAYWEAFRIGHPEFKMPKLEDHIPHD